MNVLVLNCGSSSIKYKLYNMDNEAVLAQGGVERIGLDEAFIKITLPNGEKKIIMHDMPDHKEGVNFVFKCLLDPEFGAIKDLKEIDAVGHRVVQGGFHGTSHRYVSKRVCEILGLDQNNSKVITCHIGNGGSIAAVLNGKVMDTSMGLTPLAGLMMGSRCGDIDASAVTYLMEKLNMKPQEMADFLNKKSGVLGITGISSDMRDIENAANEGNEKAQLALRMYEYRIKKYIGAYAAAMGGVDAIVFTAGVGENQTDLREESCKGLEFLGIKINKEVNDKVRGKEAIISTDDSKVKVVVVPTDEEIVIARDTVELVTKK